MLNNLSSFPQSTRNEKHNRWWKATYKHYSELSSRKRKCFKFRRSSSCCCPVTKQTDMMCTSQVSIGIQSWSDMYIHWSMCMNV